MNKISSDILKAIAPRTLKSKRDRFLPDLNKLLPHFEINSELRIAAFLATCCIESDYFKATAEYGKGKGRAYAKVYADTGKAYYGRGIIQNTWRNAYEDFTAYVKRNWSWLKDLEGVDRIQSPDFVVDPDLLTQPFWAVLGACWFWHRNKLNKYSDGGLKSFFAIQGIVNRGNPAKKALHYSDRLAVYETLRRVLSDNFTMKLDSSDEKLANNPFKDLTDDEINLEIPISATGGSARNPSDSVNLPETSKKSPDVSSNAPPLPNNIAGESASESGAEKSEAQSNTAPTGNESQSETKVEVKDGNVKVSTSEGEKADEKVAVEKPEKKGFMSRIWKKITGLFGGVAVTDVATEKLGQVQSLGLSADFWKRIVYILVAGIVIYLIYELVNYVQEVRRDKEITNELIKANTTDSNKVVLVDRENIDYFIQRGYKIVYR